MWVDAPLKEVAEPETNGSVRDTVLKDSARGQSGAKRKTSAYSIAGVTNNANGFMPHLGCEADGVAEKLCHLNAWNVAPLCPARWASVHWPS